MRLVKSDLLYAVYQGEIAVPQLRDLTYLFELKDGAKTILFGADGAGKSPRPFRFTAKDFQPYVVPDWVEKTVFYQIFPDRFANGDKANDPPNVERVGRETDRF